MDYERSTLEKWVQGIENLFKRAGTSYEGTKGVRQKMARALKSIGRIYHKIFWRHARNKDGKLTKTRVGAVLVTTLVALWMVPITLTAAWQGALMATTFKNEHIYLMSTQEIDPDGNVHSVRGCFELPCEESDAIYFRVSPSLMHTAYSLVDHGGFFYPDYTTSVVAPGVNSCQVQSYGVRIKSLMRGWDVFPHMLNATCSPYETNTQFQAPKINP